MEIVPAIDIRGGRCVRLVQGDPGRQTRYAEDPLEVACHFVACGASRIHVVDLDGAFSGKSCNREIIRKIVDLPGTVVELGGGIRSLNQIAYWLDQGVSQVILGTAAVENPELVVQAVERFGPEKIAVALDMDGRIVVVRGWRQRSSQSALEVARKMQRAGIRRFVVTQVRRDGTLAGPAVEELRELVKNLNARVTASGGVGCLEDLRRLLPLEKFGVDRVIVGKAIYEKKLDLARAVAWLRSQKSEQKDAGQTDYPLS